MPMDPDVKDFLLHLYDKLWENMGAKEGRLWSYLSVYGAAVALSLGAGIYAGAQLYAVTIVLALTVWAILIVINANWWYQRNRLIVTRIEGKFGASGAVDGVIPKSYRDADFTFERLSRASVLVLATIASLLYLKLMWENGDPQAFLSMEMLASVGLLYSLFLASTIYCVAQHQSYIESFYDTKKVLLEEGGGLPAAEIEKKIGEDRRAANAGHSWAAKGLLILILAMLGFDLLPGRSDLRPDCVGLLGLVLQIALLGVYLLIAKVQPRRSGPWWRKTLLVQVVGVALIAVSACIFLRTPYRTLRTQRPIMPQAALPTPQDGSK